MKQTMKKTLALLLVLVQVFVLLPFGMTTAKAADEETGTQTPELNQIITGTVQFGSFNYLSAKGTKEAADYVMPFVYTDDYFAAPSYSSKVTEAVAQRGRTLNWTDLEDKSLATVSLNFTMASFGSNEEITSVNDYKTEYDKNGIKFLKDCGFPENAVTSNNMGGDNVFNQFPSADSVGVIFGAKTITVWDDVNKVNKTCKLVAVGVRGAGYGAEWASNLTLGSSGVHQGFREGADKVERALDKFLSDQGITAKDAKFWVVGYSRAGAIANLVAGDLDVKYSVPKEQVYAYTFESAAGASMVESGSEPVDAAINTTNYPNIHNIINVMDVVPRVSLGDFQNNRLGVDYRVPFYGNEQISGQNSAYYNRMYSILPTVAQGYFDDDGNRQTDPAVTNAKPNTAGGTYPVDGQIVVQKFEFGTAISDTSSWGASPYDDWRGTLIPNASGTKGNYKIALDKYLDQLVTNMFGSKAWDQIPSKIKRADGTLTISYAYGNNDVIELTNPLQHRSNYNTQLQSQDMKYQDAMRHLASTALGKPGTKLTDMFKNVTDNLLSMLTAGAGFVLAVNGATGGDGYDQYPNENHAAVVDSHLRDVLLKVLQKVDAFKDSSNPYKYYHAGSSKQIGFIPAHQSSYDVSQTTGKAIATLGPVFARLFLYDRATYGSQYFGTLLKYALTTILVTHTPGLDASWQMAMDENYTSDYREITLPKQTYITVNVFREGFEGALSDRVGEAASADGSVILTVNDGTPANCRDNRIKVTDNGDNTVTIRYPGTMDYRFDVKPIRATDDLNVVLKDLAPTGGTNVEASYKRNNSTGNILYTAADKPKLVYDLTDDGSTNTPDATDINQFSDSNNIAVNASETLHIIAWNGSNSLDKDAQQDAQYAIQKTTPKTQLVDFGTVTIAENAAPGRVYQADNGEFKAAGSDVVYQLNAIQNGSGKAFANVDSANADYRADASKGRKQVYLTDYVSTVPASSVYFDDDLNGKSITSDGHGYSSNMDDENVSMNASNVSGSMYFTFYGTGIDIYCTTHSGGGIASAALYKGTDASVSANRLQVGSIKNKSDGNYYNTPTLSFTGLKQDTYTVWLYANSGAQYKLDGVRVYDPVKTGSDAETKQSTLGEGNALYLNLRDMLVNTAEEGFSVTRPEELSDDFDKATISGVLFVDNASKIATESHWYKDPGAAEDSWHEKTQKTYQTQFDAYKANSPKNEIYLAGAVKDEDENDVTQAITFRVNTDKAPVGSTIYIGMSAPKDGSGEVSVTGNGTKPVTSVMEMYYSVSVPVGGQITITNVGDSLISLTNLKITNVPESKGIQALPATERKSAMRAFFAPVTTETIELAAAQPTETAAPAETPAPIETPAPAETPAPVETPEPESTPELSSLVQQLLSSFVSSLFGSISRMFGH